MYTILAMATSSDTIALCHRLLSVLSSITRTASERLLLDKPTQVENRIFASRGLEGDLSAAYHQCKIYKSVATSAVQGLRGL